MGSAVDNRWEALQGCERQEPLPFSTISQEVMFLPEAHWLGAKGGCPKHTGRCWHGPLEILGSVEKGPRGKERPSNSSASGEQN